MSRVVLLILVLTISGSIRAKDDPEPDPMIMIRSTLKTWRRMYNSYREEMNLGYCWVDYFLDIKKIFDSFAAPRVPPGEFIPGPAHKNILVDLREDDEGHNKNDKYNTDENLRQEYGTSQDYEDKNIGGSILTGKWAAIPQEENYDPAYQGSNYPVSLLASNSEQHIFFGAEQSSMDGFPSARSLDSNDLKKKYQPGHRSSSSSLGSLVGLGLSNVHSDDDAPGNSSAAKQEHEESRELLHSRGFGNLILSMLGLDGSGYVEPSPIVFTMVRFIGTFVRVGREVMDTIDSTSVLACTKEYLWGKMLHWIDS